MFLTYTGVPAHDGCCLADFFDFQGRADLREPTTFREILPRLFLSEMVCKPSIGELHKNNAAARP
jgi:hypothetical protein